MTPSFRLFCAALITVSLFLSGCEKEVSGKKEADFPEIGVGGRKITIELALTNSEQAKGLMHRDGLAEDHGMLFVYKSPQAMSYWMKNVDFDIDIGFFTADGVLREVYPLYAQDTQTRHSLRDDLLYALEIRRSWFSDNGIRPGAQLDLESVKKAVAERRR